VKTALLLLALPLCLGAQPLTMYSDMARIDAKGQPTQPEYPREILSPLAIRNGFTSFQVVVNAPEGKPWQLFIAQNPEEYMEVTLYRESGEQLQKINQPATGTGAEVFWLDLRERGTLRADTEERIKVEPQLHIDDDWVIYPIEARVMPTSAPNAPAGGWPVGSASPEAVIRGLVCGTKFDVGTAREGLTLANLRFRNAQQDLALAASAPKTELQAQVGACDAAWPAGNPERYLRVRDFLFRER
jgi:hypothetical protein